MGIRRVLELARAHLRRRGRIVKRAALEVVKLWSRVDRGNIAASWQALLPDAVTAVARAQALAADESGPYLDAVLSEYGLLPAGDGRLRPASLVAVASDGRALDGLLYQPAISALETIRDGGTVSEAMGAGALSANLIVRTQVADAGRVADGVNVATERHLQGYVRMLTLPSCSRCIILAGKFYAWNDGFERHPNCDCVHVPAPEDNLEDLRTNPKKLFESMSEAEQNKVFTIAGAQAIRDGADMNQVVNVRRGAAGLAPAGGRVTAAEVKVLRGGRGIGRLQATNVGGVQLLTSTEGTTRRGLAGRRLRGRAPRLMPEQIYQIAGDDRDEALRLLYRNGYLLERPTSSARPRPALTFDQRAAAAAADEAALAAPRFGRDRKSRPAEFTAEMSAAVYKYSGAEYAAVNNHLRGVMLPFGYSPADVTPLIADLDRAMAASRLDRDVVVHRGVLNASKLFGSRLSGDLTGMVWREDAYLSTTTRARDALTFAAGGSFQLVMRILAPKGAPAVQASGADAEAEVLFGRGRRLRVVADRGIGPRGARYLDVEVLGD